MREAFTRRLYSRSPVLFAEHRLDQIATDMVWGLQHDDGWFAITDALAGVLSDYAPDATAVDVKQKMGALRFSLREADAFTRGASAAAGAFSRTISEVSGRRGVLMAGRQGCWLKTLEPAELADFVPVKSANDGIQTELRRVATEDETKGADAFRQAMIHRSHPVTGACAPVNDHGEMTRGGEAA